jgi:hypothetical protein
MNENKINKTTPKGASFVNFEAKIARNYDFEKGNSVP